MQEERRSISSYRDLVVWNAAVDLAVNCYDITTRFPAHELYGMTSQIRRSSTSIAANIAEGHGRESTGAFIQFLRIAQGSLKELETHMVISGRVGLIGQQEMDDILMKASHIGKMLRSMTRSLQRRTS
ncbi:four helix bundle protein [Aquibium oceanicum]|uniref:Four helix bundle protein n=1 Tax=Aquibium oceanicum TaxID=1670800 RepID=A0A1L3SSA7_9HYPH|nr:four helix bundle protein [Aquibium oceanicum]APH72192.1 hypothetical protein BSQ44_13075 [Aquibium oceanicum]